MKIERETCEPRMDGQGDLLVDALLKWAGLAAYKPITQPLFIS